MDPMEIMMEMTGFSTPQIENKTWKNASFFSAEIQCLSRASSLISLIHSQLTVLHSRSSQFARLDTTHAPFDSSKGILPRVTYLTLRRHVIARKQSPEYSYRRLFLSNPD